MKKPSRDVCTLVIGIAAAGAFGCDLDPPTADQLIGGGPGVLAGVGTPQNLSVGAAQPTYGVTVTAAKSPPPISGGTLLVTSDGVDVLAADSDRDQVYVVNAVAQTLDATIALAPGDEPGRIAEDDRGQAHVVLRQGGAIATIDIATRTLTARRAVCATPRGIAFDRAGARLLVACETGELVSLPSRVDGAASVLATLEAGLRDVVVSESRIGTHAITTIFVSRFRTAEVLRLDANGVLVSSTRPSAPGAEATLAWRMLPAPAGAPATDPFVIHQLASTSSFAPDPGSPYSSATLAPAVTQGSGLPLIGPEELVLPVDMTVQKQTIYAVAAGNGHTPSLPQVFGIPLQNECGDVSISCGAVAAFYVEGEPVAIDALASGTLIVQSREPATLSFYTPPATTPTSVLTLASGSVEDTGHAIFHSNSGANVACASCHGEGGDDAHSWELDAPGKRRTPSLRGTLASTAPYHWDGQMTDVAMIADSVLTGLMAGPVLADDQKAALQTWLFAIPELPKAPPAESEFVSASRGKALFDSAAVGCASCHSGPRFTNNATVNVGTGGSFQVPPLVGLRSRAPYLHNGCAATLADRFGKCATAEHGNTSGLTRTDVGDLIAYLNTL